MKPLYPNTYDSYQELVVDEEPLKLDFNERSDNRPLWLLESAISADCLWKYPDKSGLQSQVSQFYGLSDEQLLLTNGGDEAIELLFKYSCLNRKSLILPLPAFSQYVVGKDKWKSDIELIEPLEDMRIDLEAAQNALCKDAVLILTSPNNPTGELIPFDELLKTCQLARSKGAQVFLDEAYIEFANKGVERTLELIKKFDNVIVLRTLSKAFGLAGIRCGYLLGQSSIVSQYSELAMPFNLPSPTIEVAKRAFSDSAKLEVINYTKTIAQNREQIAELLISSGLSLVDSSANFLFVQGDESKLRLIKAACEKRNILIKTSLTGLTANNKDINAIRITIPFYIKSLLGALRLALKPELLCFDMDGVLIDTSKSYDEAIKATVKEVTKKSIEQKDIERLRGQGGFNNDWVLTQELIKEQGVTKNLEAVTEIFQKFYQGSEKQEGFKSLEKAIMTDVFSQQLFITNTRTLKIAIVTGRPKEEAIEGARMVGARNSLVISDDDVNESKPSPEGVIKASRYYGKDTYWMIGDTPDDMAAANGAGALAIGIGSEQLYQHGADLVINNVNQLETLL